MRSCIHGHIRGGFGTFGPSPYITAELNLGEHVQCGARSSARMQRCPDNAGRLHLSSDEGSASILTCPISYRLSCGHVSSAHPPRPPLFVHPSSPHLHITPSLAPAPLPSSALLSSRRRHPPPHALRTPRRGPLAPSSGSRQMRCHTRSAPRPPRQSPCLSAATGACPRRR